MKHSSIPRTIILGTRRLGGMLAALKLPMAARAKPKLGGRNSPPRMASCMSRIRSSACPLEWVVQYFKIEK